MIAYNFEQLENLQKLSYAKDLNKSQVISSVQLDEIKNKVKSNLYSPSIFVRILLFVLTFIGMSTIMGPIVMLLNIDSEEGIRAASLLTGVAILLFLDFKLIRDNKHYKSGVTEALLLSGLVLFTIGLLGFSHFNILTYFILGFTLSLIAAIRYFNLIGLIATLVFSGAMLFQALINLGGIAEALIPFAMMALYGVLYYVVLKLQKAAGSFVFDDHFILAKVFCLMVIYLAGNYFVVRELSVEVMGNYLEPGENIPFAWLFYFFTAIIPAAYLFYGIKNKSILCIRVSLLVVVLSIITLKIYFSLGAPIVTITISGAIMIIQALLLMCYLKQNKNGFTREKLLHDKWDSSDLTAFVVSQSLSGHQITPKDDNLEYGGGEFGGGGAGSKF